MKKPTLLALGLALALAAPAFADNGNGHGRGNSHHQERREDRHDEDHSSLRLTIDRNLSVRFNTHDLNVIVDWFDREPTSVRDTRGLPPGLAKQLRERGHLPPGLEAKGLPPGLASRLGPAPRGYDRVVIGRDIVLVQIATGLIADIIRDVF